MARIVMIGSGVVGTATGKGFARHGHDVEFVDIDRRRIGALRAEGFDASDVIDLSGGPAFVFLTLPTPHRGLRYDLEAFTAGVRAVGSALAKSATYHTVVVRSTVPPGTADGLVTRELEEASGRRVGADFALGSNPEFLRAASALEDFLHPWMTVVASRSRRTLERLSSLLRPFGGEMRELDNPREAELVKCAHNIFNATKISFWNEMWRVAQSIGADPEVVAETVARSAEGSFNQWYGIRGGRPYGGACLPKDTSGFVGFAREIGVQTPLLEGVIAVNDIMEDLVDAGRHVASVEIDLAGEHESSGKVTVDLAG